MNCHHEHGRSRLVMITMISMTVAIILGIIFHHLVPGIIAICELWWRESKARGWVQSVVVVMVYSVGMCVC